MVTLRTAVPADIALLQRWDAQPHVIACHSDDPDADGSDGDWDWAVELARSPDWREQFIAEEGMADGRARPVGVVQVIDPAREESHYWGDVPAGLRAIDVWIGESTDLGRGLGTAMMRLVLDRCFADASVDAVLVDPLASNVRAHRFYERLGFACIGAQTFGESACLVYRLDRSAWQARASG